MSVNGSKIPAHPYINANLCFKKVRSTQYKSNKLKRVSDADIAKSIGFTESQVKHYSSGIGDGSQIKKDFLQIYYLIKDLKKQSQQLQESGKTREAKSKQDAIKSIEESLKVGIGYCHSGMLQRTHTTLESYPQDVRNINELIGEFRKDIYSSVVNSLAGGNDTQTIHTKGAILRRAQALGTNIPLEITPDTCADNIAGSRKAELDAALKEAFNKTFHPASIVESLFLQRFQQGRGYKGGYSDSYDGCMLGGLEESEHKKIASFLCHILNIDLKERIDSSTKENTNSIPAELVMIWGANIDDLQFLRDIKWSFVISKTIEYFFENNYFVLPKTLKAKTLTYTDGDGGESTLSIYINPDDYDNSLIKIEKSNGETLQFFLGNARHFSMPKNINELNKVFIDEMVEIASGYMTSPEDLMALNKLIQNVEDKKQKDELSRRLCLSGFNIALSKTQRKALGEEVSRKKTLLQSPGKPTSKKILLEKYLENLPAGPQQNQLLRHLDQRLIPNKNKTQIAGRIPSHLTIDEYILSLDSRDFLDVMKLIRDTKRIERIINQLRAHQPDKASTLLRYAISGGHEFLSKSLLESNRNAEKIKQETGKNITTLKMPSFNEKGVHAIEIACSSGNTGTAKIMWSFLDDDQKNDFFLNILQRKDTETFVNICNQLLPLKKKNHLKTFKKIIASSNFSVLKLNELLCQSAEKGFFDICDALTAIDKTSTAKEKERCALIIDGNNRSARKAAIDAGHSKICSLLLKKEAIAKEMFWRSLTTESVEDLVATLGVLEEDDTNLISIVDTIRLHDLDKLHDLLIQATKANKTSIVKIITHVDTLLKNKNRNVFPSEEEKIINFSHKDEQGNTAFMIAANAGHQEICELLMDKANYSDSITQQNNTHEKERILHIFAKKGLTVVAEKLIKKNPSININFRNHHGETPIMIAASNGHYELSTLLLKHNAELDLENNTFETTLSLASKNAANDKDSDAYKAQEDTCSLLLKHGALRSKHRHPKKPISTAQESMIQSSINSMLDDEIMEWSKNTKDSYYSLREQEAFDKKNRYKPSHALTLFGISAKEKLSAANAFFELTQNPLSFDKLLEIKKKHWRSLTNGRLYREYVLPFMRRDKAKTGYTQRFGESEASAWYRWKKHTAAKKTFAQFLKTPSLDTLILIKRHFQKETTESPSLFSQIRIAARDLGLDTKKSKESIFNAWFKHERDRLNHRICIDSEKLEQELKNPNHRGLSFFSPPEKSKQNHQDNSNTL